jgi:hypothetical protein
VRRKSYLAYLAIYVRLARSSRKKAMTAKFKVASNIRSTINNDGGVLLNVDSGFVYSLNPVGAKIWSSLQESERGLSFDELLESLKSQYHASPQQLQSDLDVFLIAMETKGLVQKHSITDLLAYAPI